MIEDFHNIEPYSLARKEKRELLLKELKSLTIYHQENCREYSNILSALQFNEHEVESIENIPFLPVRIFKEMCLKSIPDEKVFKIMMSSGTTNQISSKIYLDKENAILQQKVLLRILGNYIGKKRLPMLVIDTESVIKNRKLFTARGATIMGLDFAASKKVFALNEDMTLNEKVVSEFLDRYGSEKFIIFGFTFMVWQHLFEAVKENGYNFNMSNGYLLTAGGWKKLENSAVSRLQFKSVGKERCGISCYIDHYSMAEQSGCIYAECEYGHLHASIYSDVIIRNPEDFSPCKIGQKGIIQVVSVLPHSYPGHSILTEDLGVILGEDDCPCGRRGKYIKILGRMKNAEIRGCSDTYASKFK